MQHRQQNSRLWGSAAVITLLVLVTSFLPYPLQAAIELPTQPYLPLTMALDAASAALAQCEADGYRVSVAVVDRSGDLKVLLKGDGAGPHTVNSSRGKAFTSASMGRATGELATMIAENPAIAGLRNMDERMLILAGGLPIVVNEVVVGGIGVGGAPGGNLDEACAQAGIDQMLAQAESDDATAATTTPTEPTSGAMLAPETLCQFAGTGATIAIAGQRANFTCETADTQAVVLLGDVTAGAEGWMIEQAVLAEGDNSTATETRPVMVTHIQLADGVLCAWAGSGATLAIDEQRVNFTCETPDLVLLGDIETTNEGWEITQATLTRGNDGAYSAESTEMAAIAALGVMQAE